MLTISCTKPNFSILFLRMLLIPNGITLSPLSNNHISITPLPSLVYINNKDDMGVIIIVLFFRDLGVDGKVNNYYLSLNGWR